MKKAHVILVAIVCLLLLLAVQIPCKTVVTTEVLSSFQNGNSDYPEELNSAIASHLSTLSSLPVFAESVYIVREEFLFKKDATTYFIPYIMADVDDVGIAGTSNWTFRLNVLVLDGEGDSLINESGKYNRSASSFAVEADPNTAIYEPSFYDGKLDHVVSITLERNKWSSMDEHVFSVHASTLDSDKPRNVESTVSFRWESALSCRFGKEVPFVVEGNAAYVNNCKG